MQTDSLLSVREQFAAHSSHASPLPLPRSLFLWDVASKMRSHKFGLAGALCVGMLLCLPATVYGAPVAETSLVVRPPMEVGEHFDAHELVKRVNLKGFFKILLGFTLTGLVCYSPAAFAIVPVNPVAWACGVRLITQLFAKLLLMRTIDHRHVYACHDRVWKVSNPWCSRRQRRERRQRTPRRNRSICF